MLTHDHDHSSHRPEEGSSDEAGPSALERRASAMHGSGSTPQTGMRVPLFSEWPGQEIGEEMDLEHYWNVIAVGGAGRVLWEEEWRPHVCTTGFALLHVPSARDVAGGNTNLGLVRSDVVKHFQRVMGRGVSVKRPS
jgi:hypothetical protein